ncbi:MAG: ABC transporter permease [Acidobacteriota bacterium]
MALITGLVAKDFRRRLRTPVGLVVMLIFPLAFAGMVGLAFGPARDSDGGLPRIKILLVDHDQKFLSGFLSNAGGNPQFQEQFDLVNVEEEDEARRMMEDGEASALLIIPEGFTDDLFDGKETTLTLLKNPAESILPQVVEEMVGVSSVFLDAGLRVVGEPLEEVAETFSGLDEDASRFPRNEELATLVVSLADRIRPLAHYLFPPAVVFDTASEEDVPLPVLLAARAGESLEQVRKRVAHAAPPAVKDEDGTSGFNIFGVLLPMVTLMSILFLGENGMRDLMTEQRAGTLSRLFSSPTGLGRVLAAKILFTLLLCAFAMAILAVVGLALGWIDWFVSLPGALVQVAAIAFASTGLATLVHGLARSERAATTLHSVLVMSMSFLGGSFIPVSQMPAPLRRLAPYTINYWGIQGLLDLIQRQGGVGEVMPRAGVLLLIGAAGVILGGRRLARRFAAAGAV